MGERPPREGGRSLERPAAAPVCAALRRPPVPGDASCLSVCCWWASVGVQAGPGGVGGVGRQRDVEGLERAVQTAKEAAARQQREEVRALQRQVEELTERREADVAALTEQLEVRICFF